MVGGGVGGRFAVVVTSAVLLVVTFLVGDGLSVVFFLLSCVVINCGVVCGTFEGVVENGMFSRGFLVAVTALKTFFVGRVPRTMDIVLFCRVNRFFRSCTISGSEGSVDSLVSVEPSCTGMVGKGSAVGMGPDRIGVKSVVIIGPNRGVPLSNIIRDNDSSLGASTLAKRDGLGGMRIKSRMLDNSVGAGKVLGVVIVGRFNRSAICGVLRLMRGTDGEGDRDRGFVAGFTECCAPVIIVVTLLLSVVPPLIFGRRLGV